MLTTFYSCCLMTPRVLSLVGIMRCDLFTIRRSTHSSCPDLVGSYNLGEAKFSDEALMCLVKRE